jgi:hypothetical protein
MLLHQFGAVNRFELVIHAVGSGLLDSGGETAVKRSL